MARRKTESTRDVVALSAIYHAMARLVADAYTGQGAYLGPVVLWVNLPGHYGLSNDLIKQVLTARAAQLYGEHPEIDLVWRPRD